MARPRIQIDWDIFDRLCEFQCTQREIADWFRISIDSIDRLCKRERKQSFADLFSQKRAGGKISLRRAQWQMAIEEHNVVMLIWLGKQFLGQRQDPETSVTINQAPSIESARKDIEEIKQLIEAKECSQPKTPLSLVPSAGLLSP